MWWLSPRGRFVALLVLGSLLLESPVDACSFINVEVAHANALAESERYWLASAIVGALVIGVEAHNKRWPLLLGVAVSLPVFHPRWLLPSSHGPDCQFINVQGSQAVLVIMCILLAYQVFRMIRSRTR